MNIQEIRAQYPQYDDMPDETLAQKLHAKSYSDMPYEDFAGKIGLTIAPQAPETPEFVPEPMVRREPGAPPAEVPADVQEFQAFKEAGGEEVYSPEAPEGIDPRAAMRIAPPIPEGEELPPEAPWTEVLGQLPKTLAPGIGQAVGGFMQMLGDMPVDKPMESGMGLGAGWYTKSEEEKRKIMSKEEEFSKSMAAEGMALYRGATGELRDIQPKVNPGSLKYHVFGAGQSLVRMSAPLAASIGTGSPAPAMFMIGGMVYGDSYGEQREGGSDPRTARWAAAGNALAEGIPEAMALGVITKPGTPFIKRLFKSLGVEELQESFTETIQMAIEKGTINPDMTWGEAKSRMKDVLIQTPMAAGAMAGVAQVAQPLMPKEAPPKAPEIPPTVPPEAALPITEPPTPEVTPAPPEAAPVIPEAEYAPRPEGFETEHELSRRELVDSLAEEGVAEDSKVGRIVLGHFRKSVRKEHPKMPGWQPEESFVVKETDPTTKKETATYPAGDRIFDRHKQTGEDYTLVDIDFSNLGGLNEFLDNNMPVIDRHFSQIMGFVKEEVQKVAPDVQYFRYGGDEFAAVAKTTDKETLDKALASARLKVMEYAEAQGFDKIPHPKPGRPLGIGIQYGSEEFKGHDSFENVFEQAALETGEFKGVLKGVKDASREDIGRDVGEARVREEPRGVPEVREEEAPRVRREKAKEPRKEAKPRKPTPSQKRSLDATHRAVFEGEAGKRATIKTNGLEQITIPSTFPEYFQNKGYRRKETLMALDKARKGVKLGKRQQMIVDDLMQEFRHIEAEALATGRPQTKEEKRELEKLGKKVAGELEEAWFEEEIAPEKKEPKPKAMAAPARPGAKHVEVRKIEELDRPEGKPRKKPLRREDAIRPLLKAFDIPLYEGRVKGAGKLGYFIPKKEEVRIKKKSDLEVTAHEIAHLLDYRIPEISRAWKKDSKLREELKSVSYDVSKIDEGFAEFVRLWMTQKELAVQLTPNFYQWFENFANTNAKYGQPLKDAQKAMSAWYEQDPLSRAKSKIGERDKSVLGFKKAFDDVRTTMRDRVRQGVSDDLHGVYKMERDLRGNIEAGGTYEVSRLTRAASSMLDGVLEIGHIVVKEDGSHTFEGKGLAEILKPVGADLENFLSYAVGRSANELKKQGRENLFTQKEIDAMLALETPEFNTAFAEYQEWNNHILDFAEAKGIINPENRALWKRMEYLPFYREEMRPPAKSFKGMEGNWKGVKKLTGGTGNLKDILSNMTQNASQLITEALKNEARVSIADMANSLEGGAKYMTKIKKTAAPTSVSKEQIRDFVYQNLFGLDMKDVKAGKVSQEVMESVKVLEKQFEKNPDFVKFWMHGQAPKGDNVVAVLRNGKPEYYEVIDPLLYRSIASLNRPTKSELVKFLGIPKRIGQLTITLTPDFMLANIARDTLMGTVMSRGGFKPLVDSARGMKSRIKKDKIYQEFIANGGGFSSYFHDESAFRKHIKRFYKKQGIDYKTVLDTPAKIAYAIENIADAFEMSTRLGEYGKARKQGLSPRHAAYLAREVSTDFAMRGDNQAIGFLYDTVIFLKAGINGLDRLYRGFAHDPNKGAVAAKTAMLAGLSTALYLINRGHEDYEDLPDWDKDMHWHFYVPQGDGTYMHFRYPKIWEIGAISTVAERGAEALIKKEGKQFAKDFKRVSLHMFRMNPIPQAFMPLYEQATNRVSFFDAPIETPSMQGLAPFARTRPTGSRALADIGIATKDWPRGMQLPPARTEALLRGYFNTWAYYGLTFADKMFYDDAPKLRVDQYPVVKRFYAGMPAKRTKYETQFWDLWREVSEIHRTIRSFDEYNEKIADELDESHADALAEDYPELKTLHKVVGGINKEIREVNRDKTMSPTEKRDAIDELVQEKNAELKEGMTVINEQRKKREE